MATKNMRVLASALTKRMLLGGAEAPAGYYTTEEQLLLTVHQAVETRVEAERPGIKTEVARAIKAVRGDSVGDDELPIAVGLVLAEIGSDLAQFGRAELRANVAAKVRAAVSLVTDIDALAEKAGTFIGRYYPAKSAAKHAWGIFAAQVKAEKAKAGGANTDKLSALLEALKASKKGDASE